MGYVSAPINLNDVIKNSKRVQKGLADWDKANDAEIIETMQRRGELKNLKAREYDKTRFKISVKGFDDRDQETGGGFSKGDKVKLSEHPDAKLGARFGVLPIRGTISGVRDSGAKLRVGKELYASHLWVRA